MKFLPLVWASLWRYRAESGLTLLALAVGFALFGIMVALNAAYTRAITDARMDRLILACAFDCGAIPLGYRQQLARIPGVTAVGAQVWFAGDEQDRQHKIAVMFADEGTRWAWPELPMSSKDWQTLDRAPTGVFLSRTAAARRHVHVGDTLRLNTRVPGSRADGGTTWYFEVLGFFPDPAGWGQWEPDLIVGNHRYWQNTGDLDERDLVNAIRVAVDRPEHGRAVCRAIEDGFANANPALYCVPARDDAEALAEATINMRQISLGIGGAGLFMITFLVAVGLAESVRERRTEFGVLKAIGYSNRLIALIVILEACVPTLLAALVGNVLAWIIGMGVARLAIHGVVDMPEILPSAAAFAGSLTAALIIALLSSVAPLYRLVGSTVADALVRR
jgi:putative ABC transport system permease protein